MILQREHSFVSITATCLALFAACSGSGTNDRRGNLNGGSGGADAMSSTSDANFNNSHAGASSLDAGRHPTGDGGNCAWARAKPVRLVPSVWIALEYSASTGTGFGVTPWTQMRDALLAPGQVVEQFQGAVDFGIAVYRGEIDEDPTCPTLTTVEPKTNNWSTISTATPVAPPDTLSAGPGHPVYALELARDRFAEARAAAPGVPLVQAVIFAPGVNASRICSKDFDARHQAGEATFEDVSVRVVREAVKGMADEGAKTFVVAFGGVFPAAPENEMLAMLGNTGHGVFSPQTPAEITTAVSSILHDLVSCQFPLNGEVTLGRECDGHVDIDGTKLDCNAANGWRLADKRTIELTGSVCEDLRAHPSGTVNAEFPCEIWKGPE